MEAASSYARILGSLCVQDRSSCAQEAEVSWEEARDGAEEAQVTAVTWMSDMHDDIWHHDLRCVLDCFPVQCGR